MPLALLIAQEIPAVIQMFKDRHAALNPTLPPLTDAEVKAALHDWAKETIAKDDAILRAHGEEA